MIRKVIVITSDKAGSGQTLFSSLLASKIKQKGYKTALLETSMSPYLPYYMGYDTARALDIVPGGIVPPISQFSYPYLSPLLFMNQSNRPVFWEKEDIVKFIRKMVLNTNWGDVDILLLDLPLCQLEMIKDLKAFFSDKLSQSLMLIDPRTKESEQAKAYLHYMKDNTTLLKIIQSPIKTKNKNADKKIRLPFVESVWNENVLASEIPSLLVDAYDSSLEEVSKVCLSIF